MAFFFGGLPLPLFFGGIASSVSAVMVIEVGRVDGELKSRGALDATLVLRGRGICNLIYKYSLPSSYC